MKKSRRTDNNYLENGVVNDIDGGLPFWPDGVAGDELFTYYPSELIENAPDGKMILAIINTKNNKKP